MEKDYRLPMGTDLGIGVDGLDTLFLQYCQSLVNVIYLIIGNMFRTSGDQEAHLQTNVVYPTPRSFLQKTRDGRLLAKWVEEFNFGVAQINKDGSNSMLLQGLCGNEGESSQIKKIDTPQKTATYSWFANLSAHNIAIQC